MHADLVRTGGLRGFQALVCSLGGDPAPLLRRCRIAAKSFEDEDSLISYRALVRVMELAATTLDCPDFGLKLASQQDVGILGPVAFAIQNAATPRHALDCAARYLFVQCPATAFSIQPGGQRGQSLLCFETRLTGIGTSRQALDLSLGATHRILSSLVGPTFRPVEVLVPHTPLADRRTYRSFFGAAVSFNQMQCGLRVKDADLDVPTPARNEALHKLAEDYLASSFANPDQSVSTRVRDAIRRGLAAGHFGRDQIAAALYLHPRTLHRRLQAEGQTFDGLLDAVRRDVALRYLHQTTMPLSRISTLLGYAEQSGLARSSQRWFGQSPREIRAKP